MTARRPFTLYLWDANGSGTRFDGPDVTASLGRWFRVASYSTLDRARKAGERAVAARWESLLGFAVGADASPEIVWLAATDATVSDLTLIADRLREALTRTPNDLTEGPERGTLSA